MNVAARRNLPPVDAGVLLSPTGDVHELAGAYTKCGTRLPDRRVRVSDLQARVHKIPQCTACYPPFNGHGRQ